ncbi:MAG: hypothetical protein M1528_02980 [Candidatus Marsarchaeota archaeon]|jgi:hypothetical protein|nr:hypothetical protein [Candidatus Marsarchaeota archaeon]
MQNIQAKDDIEKDIFLSVVAEELKNFQKKEISSIVEKKASSLYALVYDVSNKGLLADSKDMVKRLKLLVEE